MFFFFSFRPKKNSFETSTLLQARKKNTFNTGATFRPVNRRAACA